MTACSMCDMPAECAAERRCLRAPADVSGLIEQTRNAGKTLAALMENELVKEWQTKAPLAILLLGDARNKIDAAADALATLQERIIRPPGKSVFPEIVALHTELERTRAALRRVAVSPGNCRLCGEIWLGGSESHATDCRAAPVASAKEKKP